MAVLNEVWDKLKGRAKTQVALQGTFFALDKIDEEKIADYLVDFANKNYKNSEDRVINAVYEKLLKIVSAVNRRRKK